MFIYNVTIKVEHSVAAAWLAWLQQTHIPEMTGTGCFTHAVVLHLTEADDEEGKTYAVQYHADNRSSYERYIREFAEEMRRKAFDRWGNQFIAFNTVMQVVN